MRMILIYSIPYSDFKKNRFYYADIMLQKTYRIHGRRVTYKELGVIIENKQGIISWYYDKRGYVMCA
jgi:hypothetical protein